MSRRHLLDEGRRALLGPKRGHEHRQERARRDAELGPQRFAVADGRVAGDPIWDDAHGAGGIAVAHEVVPLARRDGDDGRHPRPHRCKQQALVAAVGPHPQRVGSQMLGGHMCGPLAPGERLADEMRAHPAGHDHGRPRPGQAHEPREAGRIGAVAQVRARDLCPTRLELLEVRAAAVERHHRNVEAEIGEARHQGGPLPLGAAGLEVRAHEHDPRGRPSRSCRPPGERAAIHAEHAFGDRRAPVGVHGLAQPGVAAGADRAVHGLGKAVRVARHDGATR